MSGKDTTKKGQTGSSTTHTKKPSNSGKCKTDADTAMAMAEMRKWIKAQGSMAKSVYNLGYTDGECVEQLKSYALLIATVVCYTSSLALNVTQAALWFYFIPLAWFVVVWVIAQKLGRIAKRKFYESAQQDLDDLISKQLKIWEDDDES